MLTEDRILGTALGVTCDTTVGIGVVVTSRVAGTSFSILTTGTTTSPECISYTIIN